MVTRMERGANELHMVQLMPLPPHHLLLNWNPEWFNLLVPAYPDFPGKKPLNGCSSSSCRCLFSKKNITVHQMY